MKKSKEKQPTPLGGVQAELRFWIDHHPDIHPDDACNAILARFKQKLKERPGAATPAKIEEIAEDLLLASLSNRPARKWRTDTWRTLQERVQKSKVLDKKGRDFWARLKSSKRVPEFTAGDLFMLKNWRGLRSSNPKFAKLPGLQDWHPRAAMALMKHADVDYVGGTEKWYEDRRLNLGLTPSKSYFILDAGTHLTSNGQWAVKTRD